MPYDDLLNAAKKTEARTALICAHMRLRGAKRLLQKGLSASGMIALYDSVLFGMHYYVAKNEDCLSTTILKNVDLGDATGLFHMLASAGVFDDPYAFNRLSLIVERALWQRSLSFDIDAILEEIEKMLAKLGVIPFNENILLKKSRTSYQS